MKRPGCVYLCGICNKTVTDIKWKRDKEAFTATPVCLECFMNKDKNEKFGKQK